VALAVGRERTRLAADVLFQHEMPESPLELGRGERPYSIHPVEPEPPLQLGQGRGALPSPFGVWGPSRVSARQCS
jgi:hypothetical protein